ncbi:hypothetical protein EPIB1_1971 [Tritonibacter mobilis]|nr:hypothetical protein EPIB1_1971 [Tritonibacter mobilis]
MFFTFTYEGFDFVGIISDAGSFFCEILSGKCNHARPIACAEDTI